ncbi:uncharacterized protein LOC142776166 [Rhipicephalus microplus]|uniref:uncharacterized protein LOC142776166 n=1 Tax=Rhipicephalus microplus TaxID=6941 RepID=UPI003F6D3A07
MKQEPAQTQHPSQRAATANTSCIIFMDRNEKEPPRAHGPMLQLLPLCVRQLGPTALRRCARSATGDFPACRDRHCNAHASTRQHPASEATCRQVEHQLHLCLGQQRKEELRRRTRRT